MSVLTFAGTYLAACIDYYRRYTPGIAPRRYWLPQLAQIWLPGLVASLLLAAAAFALHRRGRAD